MRLRQWDNLRSLVSESTSFADEKLYGVFADVILCSEAPIEEIVGVFKVREPNHAFSSRSFLPC